MYRILNMIYMIILSLPFMARGSLCVVGGTAFGLGPARSTLRGGRRMNVFRRASSTGFRKVGCSLTRHYAIRRAMILHRWKLRRYYASRKASLRRRLRGSDGNKIRAVFVQPERWPEPPFDENASTVRSVPWGLTRGDPVQGLTRLVRIWRG